jgi:uncharacterized membrane protein
VESDAPGIADPLGLIAAAVPAGVLAGTFTVTAAVFVVTLLREQASGAPAADPGASPAAWVLLGGTLLGILIAAATTWAALSPVRNPYRRVMFATVSAFATVVVMLLTSPVHAFFGRQGLIGLAVACLLGLLLLGRRLARLRVAR